MARPLRIEFPGAIYHVTSRGDRHEDIFEDDIDRRSFLEVVSQALRRFDAVALAYCLMDNHYHFVIHTRRANLSRLMRQINGIYTQAYNRRHHKVGHLFQGRFKGIIVDRDAYLLEVCRYVDLNPVRARMVRAPGNWPWSSYAAHTCAVAAPEWLDTPSVHGYVLGRPLVTRRIEIASTIPIRSIQDSGSRGEGQAHYSANFRPANGWVNRARRPGKR